MKNKGRKHLATGLNCKGYLTNITRPITQMGSRNELLPQGQSKKWIKKKWNKRVRGYFKTEKFVLLSFLFLPFFLNAQVTYLPRITPETYIQDHTQLAKSLSVNYNIPYGIILAISFLETGGGTSKLALLNNHFGLQCKHQKCKHGTCVKYVDDGEEFLYRSFPTVYDSYLAFCQHISTSPRYQFLKSIPITDYENWAYGLKKGGYGKDKNYAQKLIRIVKQYNLQ